MFCHSNFLKTRQKINCLNVKIVYINLVFVHCWCEFATSVLLNDQDHFKSYDSSCHMRMHRVSHILVFINTYNGMLIVFREVEENEDLKEKRVKRLVCCYWTDPVPPLANSRFFLFIVSCYIVSNFIDRDSQDIPVQREMRAPRAKMWVKWWNYAAHIYNCIVKFTNLQSTLLCFYRVKVM